MKLNQYQKQAFVRAVMDDTPFPSDEQIKDEVQAAVVEAMSSAVREVYRIAPNALATNTACVCLSYYSTRFVVGDVDLHRVTQPWTERLRKRAEAKNQLEGVVNGCSTLAQLKKMLPEFEKYMPSETMPTKNLPVIANIVTSLTELGWPKGAEVAA
ncbi:MAG: Nmad5 family putative nucleotide modification protein [Betaproteobacteria bacterium]|nr:Nmad5 family putative nucleotide modification protein [Betaproteobacteria bacterium]